LQRFIDFPRTFFNKEPAMSSPQTLIQIAGGSPRAATWQEAVLLIIDHQTEYTTGRAPLAGIDAAVGQVANCCARLAPPVRR
jgi:hypothetical protein